MRVQSPFLSVLLTFLIVLNPLWAQSQGAPHIDDGVPPLHVAVIRDAGVAKPNSSASQGFVVKVTDNSGTGVEDVAVALRLPDQSDSGTFPDGSRSAVVYTDAKGEAEFEAIHWGDLIGPLDLKITAAKGSVHAGLLVTQDVAGVLPVQPSVAAEPTPQPPPAPQTVVQSPKPGELPKALADAVPLPVSHSGATAAKPADEPTVSIVNTRTGAGGHPSRKTILLIALIGAGAGVGALVALSGHGSNSGTTSAGGITIGQPTISVGH